MPTVHVRGLELAKRSRLVDQRLQSVLAGVVIWLPAAMACATSPASALDFSSLSIEELSTIKITSVSRRSESLSDAAASIYVITGEDIRRSGAMTLPEALRLAPNLEVARVGTGPYAISARGFNNGIGNKLLVLLDGRTVYTSLFSTVNWDSQFVLLEDVARIEVISGPGATLWGANAVNGVINVITRSGQDTRGTLVGGSAGNRESAVYARHGGTLGEDGGYRIYAQRLNQGGSQRSNGSPVADGWQSGQIGFRADWGGGLTVQGDAYRAQADPGPLGAPLLSGANLLVRWTRQLADGSNIELQSYYDQTDRDDPLTYRDQVSTFDVQLQHGLRLGTAQRLLWGAGYRVAQGSTQTHFNSLNLRPQVFMPADRRLQWGSLFVQDQIAISPAFSMTLGIKAETNVYTGVEYLPSARFAWKLADNQLMWGALSRAVRAPARLDRDYYIYLALPGRPLMPVIQGGPDFQSEIANVAELGYRAQPNKSFSYSITGFYSEYDKLRSGQPPPAVVQNMMDGSTHGLEAWANYQPTADWRLSMGATALRQNLRIKPGSRDPTGPSALGNDPDHTWQLRSAWNITGVHQLDLIVRHVGALPSPEVPAYTAVDGRFNWQLHRDLGVALSVQNLFDAGGHAEFGAPASRSIFKRNVAITATWRL